MAERGKAPARVAILGAGQTGRGFIGRLLAERGVPFLLIDRDEKLAGLLAREGSYRVRFFGGVREPVVVKDFRALGTAALPFDNELEKLRLMFISVGAANLEEAGGYLAGLVGRRAPVSDASLSVVMCENAQDAADRLLEGAIGLRQRQGLDVAGGALTVVNAAVFCTTTSASSDSLDINSEDYPSLECGSAMRPPDSLDLSFLKPVDDMNALMRRKLFTYNALSAILAYLGWWKGYTLLAEAWADPAIRVVGQRYLEEVNAAIVTTMGVDPLEQDDFAARAAAKFANAGIADPIARNAREALRKLSPEERIVGSLSLLRRAGRDYRGLIDVAAIMLIFSSDVDGATENLGPADVARLLAGVTGLSEDDPFVAAVLERYALMRQRGHGSLISLE